MDDDATMDENNKEYLIQGRSYKEWLGRFTIELRQDMKPSEVRDATISFANLYQEASDNKAFSECKFLILKANQDKEYKEIFGNLVKKYQEEGKKLPAKDTLSTLTQQEIDNISIAYAEIEMIFWKGILNKLEAVRKSLELISISLSAEAKASRL